ncbi:predicted protein [Nematostella vectensis]|uniref:glutathione gamma-glutamylcysteinyltransferase n=1 Tax=Nematostella vectensis TaxID=45351 RepID=A7RVC5_NEMVE|nr:glutathione gamma-glutamylcysteinyltransferase 3 [Nematostella vectensis]EDO44619.1 predicted protein [Nematostella vectensis]|eukprot:XP_001636682.1 predicted protein [Nematostella vectensis]
METFHCYELPEDLLDYRSSESRRRLSRCLSNGSAVPFLSLSSCYNTQSELMFCGLSSLAVTLNALRIDPQRIWKTPWRWFTEELLDNCRPIDVVREAGGITMEEFSCLAKCNGAVCSTTRAEDTEQSFQLFRDTVISVCTGRQGLCTDNPLDTREQEPLELMVLSFHRSGLNQIGAGHYSPIAAYDDENDSALILDVSRYKYPPFWAPVRKLFDAMLAKDPVTNKSRGYFVLKAKKEETLGCCSCHRKIA